MRVLIVAAAIVAFGCATADVMRLDSEVRPPKSPAAVQLLLEQPSMAYTAIALVEVSAQGWGLKLETLRTKLVAEAAKLGGEAVILSRRTSNAGSMLMPVGNQFFNVPLTESGLVGQVIVYRKSTAGVFAK